MLTIDQNTARRLYPQASGEFKQLLEDKYGNALQEKITDKVQNFDDILSISGKSMADLQKPGDSDDEVAYKQIKLICEVYNEGMVLDPSNNKQYKYYPWHEVVKDSSRPSGFGLSCDGCGSWCAYSDVGVRHCFKTLDLAIDAGKKFIDIYERLKIR